MTPAEIAAGVAADIRKYGHFQGYTKDRKPNTRFAPAEPCCILRSPTVRLAQTSGGFSAFLRLLPAVHGLRVAWNDRTPTADVLAVLDSIAAGAS